MSSGMDDSKLRLQWRDHGNELSSLSRDVFCYERTPFLAHKGPCAYDVCKISGILDPSLPLSTLGTYP